MTERKVVAILGSIDNPNRVTHVEMATGERVPVDEVTIEEWAAIGIEIDAKGNLIPMQSKLH